MEKITKQEAIEQLKKEYDEEIRYIKSDEYDFVKDTYPKAYDLIQKLDDTKQYINMFDYQNGTWAVGFCGTARAWALHICSWADSDGYEDDYENPEEDSEDISTIYLCPLMNYFKSEEEVIGLISEIWTIDIQELIK